MGVTREPDPVGFGDDQQWMRAALVLAQNAASAGEVPVGAILVKQGVVIAQGGNQPIATHDPSAHAEVVVLREAAKAMANYRLADTTLYVTLEPCIMCVGAIIQARVSRLVYGARDPKTGAVGSVYDILGDDHLHHRVRYQGGVLAEECAQLLTNFFKQRR